MTFLPVAFQVQAVADRSGKFILIMGYHNHCFIPAGAESLYDLLYSAAIVGIQSMQRFVKNQQIHRFQQQLDHGQAGTFTSREYFYFFIDSSGPPNMNAPNISRIFSRISPTATRSIVSKTVRFSSSNCAWFCANSRICTLCPKVSLPYNP